MSSANSQAGSILPLRLTAFEQFMLADDTPLYPMTFFIQIAVTGDLRRAEFENAFQAAVNRHPLLTATLRRRLRGPEWVAAEAPEVQWCGASLPQISFDDRYLDLDRQPGLRVWVESAADQAQVLFQFHHAATDGIGAIQFIGDVLAVYGCATASCQDERPQMVDVDLKCLQHRGEKWEVGKRPPQLLRRWIGRAIEVLSVLPCRIQRRSIVDAQATTERPLFLTRFLERAELRAFNHEATRRGVTSNELLALAMFQTVSSWNRRRECDAARQVYRIAVPATVRTPVHADSPAANIVSYILLTRRGRQIEDAESLLKFIAAESRQVLNDRETGLVLLSLEVACLIPGLLRQLLRLPVRLATTVLANVGDVKRQLRNRFPLRRGKCVAGNIQLDVLLGAAPVRNGTHVATSVGKYAGRLIINLNCDSRFFQAAEAQAFADCFLDHVKQLYQTSGGEEQTSDGRHACLTAVD